MAAISNPPLVSVEEYVARFVERGEKPLCEYAEGVLLPKAMPTLAHSLVQANVLFNVRKDFGEQFEVLPELTARVLTSKFYVPDIAIADRSRTIAGRYPGPSEPVFLCIEIKSPDDRIGKLFSKCEEYHAWGVGHCWVIDPERKVAWEYQPGDAEPRKVDVALTAGSIRLTLAEVFRGV